MDVREQAKRNTFYTDVIKQRAAVAGEDTSQFVSSAVAAINKREDKRDLDVADKNVDKKHWSEKQRTEMTDRDWKIFREDFEITIRGGRVPPPMRTWAEGPLTWELLEAVSKAGYDTPTPIQMQAIPIACQCRDLIGLAQTGSGKTACYTLPLLQ
jgi:ATP-dependent RNA helicase DDX23/PRP28